jgi:hypothetical protein
MLDSKLSDGLNGKKREIELVDFQPPKDIYDEVNKNNYDAIIKYS